MSSLFWKGVPDLGDIQQQNRMLVNDHFMPDFAPVLDVAMCFFHDFVANAPLSEATLGKKSFATQHHKPLVQSISLQALLNRFPFCSLSLAEASDT